MSKGVSLLSIIAVGAVMLIAFVAIGVSSTGPAIATGNDTGTDSSLKSTEIPGQHIPAPTGYVNDTAGVLSPSTKLAVETKLANFAATGAGEIAVLVVPSLNGLTIEEYGIRVGEAWKVGKYGQDNGSILIISTGDRKVRIETGSGSKLTDAQTAGILSSAIVPHLKKNDWDGGVTDGVDTIMHVMATN